MENVKDALQKVVRFEDQALIGLGRASRTIAVGVRVAKAVEAELTGEDEKAIAGLVVTIGEKLQEIVGVRPATV